jgi:fused signal recognition particle receptor
MGIMKQNIVRRKYEEMNPDRVVTLSNMISILRVFLTLPILYFLRAGQGKIALIFIIIAIVSDMLDGWLARVSHEITELGKVLDPFADKVVIFSVMLFLIFTDRMPIFYFVVLAVRDLTIALFSVYLMNNCKITPHANFTSKISIYFTTATLLAFIYSNTLGRWINPIMWSSVALLFISWVQYIITFTKQVIKVKRKVAVPDKETRLSQGLQKTGNSIAARLPLVGKYFRIEPDMLTTIEETLLAADMGVELTGSIIDRLRQLNRQEAGNLNEILKAEIEALIHQDPPVSAGRTKPWIILIVGVNGTGKTTSIAKLAHRYIAEGKQVLMVAADTFRAAAYDQLKIWAERTDADFVGNPQGKDPSSVVFDAVKSAQAKGHDFVLIDTAGRLHTKSNLMAELGKIKRVIGKLIPAAPHEIWLVLDGNTGQNGLAQAQEFMNLVGITGIILTKLDGTAKGGAVLAIHQKLNIPIRYLGVGEQLDDLVEFEANEFIDALLSVPS